MALALAGCAAPAPQQTLPPPVEPTTPEAPGAPTPSTPDTEVQLAFEQGSSALGAGRYSDAIPHLYKVLDKEPQHTLARYNLGVALQRVRQWQESADVLTAKGSDAIAKRGLGAGVEVPQDVDADYLHALGGAYQEMRQFDAALACYDAAIATDKNHLKSRYSRALCLQFRGDLREARAAWRDYIARDPDSSWTESARKHLAEVETRLSTQPR